MNVPQRQDDFSNAIDDVPSCCDYTELCALSVWSRLAVIVVDFEHCEFVWNKWMSQEKK